MNQGDIKLAIDMLDGFWTDNPNDTAVIEHCINTLESCGNEISKLQANLEVARHNCEAQERETDRLRALCDRLGEALDQIAWLTVSGTKGNNLANAALAAWRETKGHVCTTPDD